MNPLVYASKTLDFDQQVRFLNGPHLRFNHLDWVSESSWLRSDLSYTLMHDGEILAMLSCANECKQSSWIRYFVCKHEYHHATALNLLLESARKGLKTKNIPGLYALAAQEWVQRLLENESFGFYDNIIMLHLTPTAYEKNQDSHSAPQDFPFTFRRINNNDLEEIHTIDQEAFPAIWQLGMPNIQCCFEVSNINLLAMCDNQPVAYLLSENIFGYQHLSRIAVKPAFQRRHLAARMVKMMLDEGITRGVDRFSVNTNQANKASLALYHRFGYTETDQTLPIYGLDLAE